MSDAKDTIYIDVDDEITSIIGKVQDSKHHIVALVLPKRAAMLQSSVNMKLLKKAADSAKKQVVLISTEAGLLPLAGAVGLYAAKTLQSKPEIPDVTEASTAMDDLLDVDENAPEDFDASQAAAKPVGELAGLPTDQKPKAKPELAPRPIPRAADEDAAVELDNSEPEDKAEHKAAKVAKPKDKKLRVPNFEKFRLRLFLIAGLGILLIVGLILANVILPHATINIQTTTSKVSPSLTLNLSTTAKSLDPSNLTLPAQLQQSQKSQSQTVNTTGQKNLGQTASGSITLTAKEGCNGSSFVPPENVPSGTGVTTNSLNYITQQSATFGAGQYSPSDNCIDYKSSAVKIVAQSGGTQYNTSSANFTVNSRSDVTGSGSASGGTDNIVQVVSQADITNATQKLTTVDTSSIKTTLTNDLKAGGFYPISATFNAGTPSTSNSANVGDQASTVTVTQAVNYTMFGVKKTDLQGLVDDAVNGQIDTKKQSILDDGLASASFSTLSQSGTGAQVSLQTTSTIGPKLDLTSLKNQIMGKKAGDVKSIIGGNPGVTNVNVHFSPFWVGSTPKSTSKITIKLTKANQ